MNISSRLHSWKRMTTAVQCLEQCLVSKAFAKGLNNLNKSYCGGCERKLFHVGVSRFPRLSLTWDVSLSSAHCSVLMAILSARWQRDDRPEYVSGRTRICNHRHRRRGGTRSVSHNSITGPAPARGWGATKTQRPRQQCGTVASLTAEPVTNTPVRPTVGWI